MKCIVIFLINYTFSENGVEALYLYKYIITEKESKDELRAYNGYYDQLIVKHKGYLLQTTVSIANRYSINRVHNV